MSTTFFDGVIGHEAILRVLSSSVAHPAPAYVLTGRPHLGKRTIAEQFVRALLQLPPQEGTFYTHPDFILLEPEEGKKQVSVEQVRALRERVMLRPMVAPRVVVFVPAADRLNESGTNALLKVLEEPPAGAVFVLIAEDLARLPATVLSRSVVLSLQPVAADTIMQSLIARGITRADAEDRARRARGCPGLALEPQEDHAIGARFTDAMMHAPSLGERLRIIEELAKSCESTEDVSAAWRDALLEAMNAMRTAFAHQPMESSVFGIALLQAFKFVGGALSPRIALDAGAVRMSDDRATAQAVALQPTHLPRAMPLFFEEL